MFSICRTESLALKSGSDNPGSFDYSNPNYVCACNRIHKPHNRENNTALLTIQSALHRGHLLSDWHNTCSTPCAVPRRVKRYRPLQVRTVHNHHIISCPEDPLNAPSWAHAHHGSETRHKTYRGESTREEHTTSIRISSDGYERRDWPSLVYACRSRLWLFRDSVTSRTPT